MGIGCPGGLMPYGTDFSPLNGRSGLVIAIRLDLRAPLRRSRSRGRSHGGERYPRALQKFSFKIAGYGHRRLRRDHSLLVHTGMATGRDCKKQKELIININIQSVRPLHYHGKTQREEIR